MTLPRSDTLCVHMLSRFAALALEVNGARPAKRSGQGLDDHVPVALDVVVREHLDGVAERRQLAPALPILIESVLVRRSAVDLDDHVAEQEVDTTEE